MRKAGRGLVNQPQNDEAAIRRTTNPFLAFSGVNKSFGNFLAFSGRGAAAVAAPKRAADTALAVAAPTPPPAPPPNPSAAEPAHRRAAR